MADYSDNFNRSDGTLTGGIWTHVGDSGDWNVASNKATAYIPNYDMMGFVYLVAAQQAAAHAQAATEAYKRAATAVAAAMGISKATPKELDADESGMFFVVEAVDETAGETAATEDTLK